MGSDSPPRSRGDLHQKQNGLREQSVFVFAEDYTEPSHTELCESTAPGFAQENAEEE